MKNKVEEMSFTFYSVTVFDPDDRIVESHNFNDFELAVKKFKYLKKRFSEFYTINVYRHENIFMYDSKDIYLI